MLQPARNVKHFYVTQPQAALPFWAFFAQIKNPATDGNARQV
jgi:hypothetical protein